MNDKTPAEMAKEIRELKNQLAILTPAYYALLSERLNNKHKLETCEELLAKCLNFMNNTTGRNTILVAQVREYLTNQKQ